MKLSSLLRRARRHRVLIAAAALPMLALVGVTVLGGSTRGYLAVVLGTALLALAWFTTAVVEAVATARSGAAAMESRAVQRQGDGSRDGAIPERKLRGFARWSARLNHGWSESALPVLMKTAYGKKEHPGYRLKVMAALADWYAAKRREMPPRTLDLDIVLVSNMNLQGGTTSSNAAEVLAFREAGLKVGLLHHPVRDWNLARPMNPKLAELVDDEQVFGLRPDDTVRCDLMIVRFATAMVQLMEDLSEISPKRTILVINQTPFEEYGLNGGYGRSWSIAAVHANLTEWVGPHTWYAIGPAVREAMVENHAAELAGIDFPERPWFNTIDPAKWELEEVPDRADDAPIRIGRHSRDHLTKWPNMADMLRQAYPAADDIEVHVMGGEAAVRRILGTVPSNWVSHPFGAMSATEFLASLDVYVYFIDDNYIEAFGRAPLEALAAGVPCILPPSFEKLFGDGAIYCEPGEVEDRIRRLMADRAYYLERVEAGKRVVRERFSPGSLLRRVAELGVEVSPESPASDLPEPSEAAAGNLS